jgi:cyanophycinase
MRLTRLVTASISAACLALLASPAPGPVVGAERRAGYEYHVAGNAGDVARPTRPGFLLMGGGGDVDAAFQWMVEKSGGGDFVVLRASGGDAYNPYVLEMGVDSCETIVINDRAAASDGFVVDKIRNAEAVFIAGGDQRNYVHRWKGTPVEDAIHYVASRGAPIGGTSAGLAILGEFLFPAENDTVTSAQALADPFDRRVVLDRTFLSFRVLNGVITDSHFAARDRMGRLVTFLGRIIVDGWAESPVRAVGIDEKTAVVLEADGAASIRGKGAAYFLKTQGAPEACRRNTPLTFTNVSVYKVSGKGTFDLTRWAGSGGTAYTISANNGVLSSSTGSVY